MTMAEWRSSCVAKSCLVRSEANRGLDLTFRRTPVRSQAVGAMRRPPRLRRKMHRRLIAAPSAPEPPSAPDPDAARRVFATVLLSARQGLQAIAPRDSPSPVCVLRSSPASRWRRPATSRPADLTQEGHPAAAGRRRAPSRRAAEINARRLRRRASTIGREPISS